MVPKKNPSIFSHVIHTLAKTMMKLNPMWNLHYAISQDEMELPQQYTSLGTTIVLTHYLILQLKLNNM